MSGTAGDTSSTMAAAEAPSAHHEPRVRRARLRLGHVDPWTATKLSFVLSIAFGIVLLVAVALLWFVLDALGVFQPVANVLHDFTADAQGNGFNLLDYVAFGRVISLALLVACINVVLLTLLGTISAVLYNLAASFTGGLQVTFTEDAAS